MTQVKLELADEILDELVERAAERVLAAQPPVSPYMSVQEAAVFLRCKPQRVANLLSARKLTRLKEGGRTLVRRAEVEALIENGEER